MIDVIFGNVWGWLGTAGLVVIACIVVGYLFPQLRLYAAGIAGIFIAGAYIYTKGWRDNKRRRDEKIENARKELQDEYKKIDDKARNGDPLGDLVDRLQHGKF